jgi:hypothetical protein
MDTTPSLRLIQGEAHQQQLINLPGDYNPALVNALE